MDGREKARIVFDDLMNSRADSTRALYTPQTGQDSFAYHYNQAGLRRENNGVFRAKLIMDGIVDPDWSENL